jgi:hypothetical protein
MGQKIKKLKERFRKAPVQQFARFPHRPDYIALLKKHMSTAALSVIAIFSMTMLMISCGQKDGKTEKNALVDQSKVRKGGNSPMTKTLEYGFQINGTDREYFEQYGVFTKLEVVRNGTRLFEHDYIEEFEIETLESYVFKLDGENSFELVFECTSPPSKPWLTLYRLENDKIISIKKLPSMDVKPINLDDDDLLEFAGYWNWSEVYGSDYEFISYNPLLFYEVTGEGIKIDSVLTVKTNEEIWGQFEGFEYSDKIPKDSKSARKLEEMIERFKKF